MEDKMAYKLTAIKAYYPQIILGKTIDYDTFMDELHARTSMTKGQILCILTELQSTLLFFFQRGYPVKIKGIGIFSPSVNISGLFNINFRPDNEFKIKLNEKDLFFFKIKNKRMMGKNLEDLFKRWNKEHPDDPIKE
jgi:hypothetical protein